MQIFLRGLGKKFNREWIFKDLNKTIQIGQPLAITGPNGSGKSTLLQIISGWSLPSAGEINYFFDGKKVSPDHVFRHMDYVAPYTELIEEMTLNEFLKFHFKFKNLRNGISIEDLIRSARLEKDRNKLLKYYSSGMKQRLKLSLGFFSACPLLLLDEPVTNLDAENKLWYSKEIKKVLTTKMIIIASNQEEEYTFADDLIKIGNFK